MPKTNTNVLAGLKCPKCESLGPYFIVATCWAQVQDDGVYDTSEFEWTENSRCDCKECGFHGKVRDFEPKRKNSGNKKGGVKRG
jgi:Zn ribbon nucleic-acid-binding protein